MQDLCVWIGFTEIIKKYDKALLLHIFDLIVNDSYMHMCSVLGLFCFFSILSSSFCQNVITGPPCEMTDFSLVTYAGLLQIFSCLNPPGFYNQLQSRIQIRLDPINNHLIKPCICPISTVTPHLQMNMLNISKDMYIYSNVN